MCIRDSLRVVRVPEHAAEKVCKESARTAKDIECIQVFGDSLLDVCDRRRVGGGVGAAARSSRGHQEGAGGGRCQRSAQGPAQLGHLILLVLLHFLLGPAKQKAPLIVHFAFLCTAAIHKWVLVQRALELTITCQIPSSGIYVQLQRRTVYIGFTKGISERQASV